MYVRMNVCMYECKNVWARGEYTRRQNTVNNTNRQGWVTQDAGAGRDGSLPALQASTQHPPSPPLPGSDHRGLR